MGEMVMPDENPVEDENNLPIQKSILVVEFASPTSTQFDLQANGVNAFQLLLMSQYLEILGKNALAQEATMQMQKRLEEEARKKILTPEDVRKSIPL